MRQPNLPEARSRIARFRLEFPKQVVGNLILGVDFGLSILDGLDNLVGAVWPNAVAEAAMRNKHERSG